MFKIILLLDFAEDYSKNLLKGVSKYSQEHGPWIYCRMPLYYRESIGMDGILEWAKEWEADGIIGQLYNDIEINKFLNAGISVIAQDFKERFKEIPNITGAYREAGAMGAEYFLKKGFKNFAFYGFNDIVWSRERAEGFEERVNSAGYEVHYFEHKMSRSTDLWYYKSNSLSQWLESLPKPIAIMTCDDNQGLHITEACRQIKIRIPEEISVLGVDNDEMLCELSDPPLSSIALDIEKGGYDSAKLLHKMIKGLKTPYDIFVKPTQVITRHSTDIYATNDVANATTLRFIHKIIEKNHRVEGTVKRLHLSRRSMAKRLLQITGMHV